jgi:nucleoside-diphosphate-sugar epimerase
MQKNKILITGGTGFIGRAIIRGLIDGNNLLVAPARKPLINLRTNIIMPFLADIAELPPSCEWLEGCNIAIHVAAKAHVVGESLASFRRINTAATLCLAKHCAAAGVKRFIFLSSIGVNGISNVKSFSVSDAAAPVEDYAVSKFEAENGLKRISVETGMEVVIIRPPLVYGHGAPGNFGKLTRLAQKNLPLPLGSIHNKRSLVALDNLIDLIVTCINHPKAANQTFLVSDDRDVSVTELLKMMTLAAGKKSRLIPVPLSLLTLSCKLIGKQAVIERLSGNLQVDISHTKETLNWKPPITIEEGINRCFIREESC